MVIASIAAGKPFLSQSIIKALNFQAISCLHTHAGEYRPCEVEVTDGEFAIYKPPEPYRVQALMDDFVNNVNRMWDKDASPVVLASYVLWKINYIHPFINGNGRTARASAYFVLCVSAGGWLPGNPILPELLRQNRDQYIRALVAADESLLQEGLDLSQLHNMLSGLVEQQLKSAKNDQNGNGDVEP